MVIDTIIYKFLITKKKKKTDMPLTKKESSLDELNRNIIVNIRRKSWLNYEL